MPPPTAMTDVSDEELCHGMDRMILRYQVTGCAAHSRLVPLMPTDWINESPYNRESKSCCLHETLPPDFLWENSPRRETQVYRDSVKCYSHLPNGTAILDDKCTLARLFSDAHHHGAHASPHLATLESHCFRGITGFQKFCSRVQMFSSVDNHAENRSDGDDNDDWQFHDLTSPASLNNARIPPCPSNLWVVKDASSNGAGGIWIVGPQNAKEYITETLTPLIEEHRYVAQQYAWPPVLYKGRKAHVRVYGLMTSDDRAFIHQKAFLHVANEPFSYQPRGTEFEDSVHITNCCANSHDPNKFAGEICADMDAKEFEYYKDGHITTVPLADFFPSIAASLAELSRRAFPFLRGGEANNGFEYLGMDFILSYNTNNDPVAYMLEVNAPPSQDTATGLSHAESLHDDVIRDILSLWVIPKVTNNTADEKPSGWKCVYDGRNNDTESSTSLIVPSKAVILNKIRWAIFERKHSKMYDESEDTVVDGSSTPEIDGKTSSHEESTKLSSDQVAAFARTQFPYFVDNAETRNVSSSSFRHAQAIFFENAGGSQVPYQVIRAMNSSLSHRNRCVIGTQSKKAARRTISCILGASADEHAIFFGANASCLFDRLAHNYVGQGLLSREDEVILSTENHLANVTPWISAAQAVGAKIKWWHVKRPVDNIARDGSHGESHDLRDLLSKRTRVVAMSHASNVLGQVRDVKAICKLVKDRSDGYAHVVVDGVAATPHVHAGVSDSGVDWYAVSCHKLFGPHIGALCGRRAVANLMNGTPNQAQCDEQDLCRDMEVGTINYEACAGINGIGQYFQALANFSTHTDDQITKQTRNQCTESWRDRHEDRREVQRPNERLVDYITKKLQEEDIVEAYQRIRVSEASLVDALRARLCSCSAVRIVEGHESESLAKLPVFSFLHQQIPSREIVRKCRDNGIECRQSLFLSTKALQDHYGFGSHENKGVVRVSLAHYNTTAEVEYLMETLESIPCWWKTE